MAYVTQQIIKTTEGWATFDALGKPVPKDYWLFERATETVGDITQKYYKFKLSDGVSLFADLSYQLLNGHSASINEAGNWLVYDDATQVYKDSGVKAIGVNGKSAFELWQDQEGNADKTLVDFFIYLKGEKGDAFTFDDFTIEQLALLKGASAYQVWKAQDGNEDKTVDEYLQYIKGAPFTYADFTPEQIIALTGKSAYQIWLDQPGNEGKTIEQYLIAIKGQDGQSAYLDAVAKGYAGTKDEFDTLLAGISKGVGSIVIPSAFTSLILANKSDLSIVTSEEILASVGGENGFNGIYDGVTNKSSVLMAYLLDGIDILCPVLSMTAINQEGIKGLYLYAEFNTPGEQGVDYQSMFIMLSVSDSKYVLGGVVSSAPHTAWIDLNELIQYGDKTMPDDIYKKVEDAFINKTNIGKLEYYGIGIFPLVIANNPSDYTITAGASLLNNSDSENNLLSTVRIIVNKTTKATKITMSDLAFIKDGDGTKALMNNGQYKDVLSPTDVFTVTSLDSLSPTKYSQKYTYATATAQPINFASAPAEGFECILDIKNGTASQITQAIPNAAAWQCEETSLVIPAGKVGCMSIRYVHGIYCVRVGL